MAIVNDAGQLIYCSCPELLENIRQDCKEFRRSKTAYAACRVQEGVKIIFDYVFDIKDTEQTIPLNSDEWYEKTTLGKILAYVTRLNNPTNHYENFNELFDATGMTEQAFADCVGIDNKRTIQDWRSGNGNIGYKFEWLQAYLKEKGLL